MKIKSFSIISIIIFAALVFSGCSDSITNSNSVITPDKYQALTEAQFSRSSNLSAIPGQVVFLDLESPGTAGGDDTGINGTDEITYSIGDNAIYRFALGADTKFAAKLTDWTGAALFQLNNPGDTARIHLNPGDYKLTLISTSTASKPQTVFIQPDVNAIKSGKGVRKDGVRPEDLNTLLETGMCEECNLRKINIQDKNLSASKFIKSDLSLSDFSKMNMDSVIFLNSKIDSLHLWNSKFNYSKLDSTSAIFVDFDNVDMKRISISNSNFSQFSFLANDQNYITNAVIKNSDFTYGKTVGMSYDSTSFSETSFANSYVTLGSFKNTKFQYCNFNNSALIDINFQNSDFSGAYINRMRVIHCNFSNCRIKGFNGDKASFEQADFTDATVTGNIFTNAVFNGDLIRTTFTVNDIRGATFCTARIQFITAYDNLKDYETTCFPY
jgi:uncharacterized protein YjbI with pentapeptide repeats